MLTNIPYIDVHSHLDYPVLLNDVEKIKNEMVKNGVIAISNGVNPKSNRKNMELISDNIKVALGIYPIDALFVEKGMSNDFDVDKEIDFIRNNKDKILAIGEVGLDYYNGGKELGSIEAQKKVFLKIIKLSVEIKKPMLIHSRKAERDVVNLLEESGINPKYVVLHCFSGKKSLINRAIKAKWHFTIPTNVGRNESFQWMVRNIDLNHLFCETDSPWLSPFGREEINNPVNVIEGYKKVSELKKQELEEVKRNIFMNYQRVFL